ncbi:MAG TPA: TonB-dependent receptor [Allosphingosinicella sp.]|nr:TonB-dependent receptor [Allosphingosinicella sp.]
MQLNFRRHLLASTLLMGAAAFGAAPAWAQVADDNQPENAVEATIDPDAQANEGTESIVVTGSRIRRPDLTSTSPVAVVQDEEFQLSGSVNVEQVLNTLPQVVPGVTGFSNNPGNGAVTLNLRNLGSIRTLVLVNGRRWMFYDVSQVPDLNTIPQFMLESVDVVTGGASAVYGSDAIAGVVNFRLRQDLEGVHLGGLYALTEEGDGARYTVDGAIGAGFADGRGNVTAFGSYTRRRSVFQGDRAFSRFAAGDVCIVPGSTDPRTGLGTPFGTTAGQRLIAGCTARGGEVGLAGGGSPTTPTATFVNFAPALYLDPQTGELRQQRDPEDLYNYAPSNYLQLPQERYLIGSYGSFEITKSVVPFVELSFVNSVVAQELAPTPAAVAAPIQLNSPFLGAQARGVLSAFADPANPGYTVPLFVARRFTETGARNTNQNRDAFRVLAGLKGDITDAIQYEAFYSYSRTRNTQFQQGNIVSSRFAAALETEFGPGGVLRCRSATARAQGCVPLNVFGTNTISPEALRYVTVSSTNQDISDLQNALASISGSLFNLGTGAADVGFAAGVEYREPSSRYQPDAFLASGDIQGFNAGQPTQGRYNVKEVFGELLVPVLRNNFIHRLELNGAARYSDYSLRNVGGVWAYAAGAELAPIPDITFRGQYQRAVRAPNVAELFGGQSTGFPGASDPCSDRGPAATRTETVRQLCIQSGVPANVVFTRAVQPASQIQGFFGGNPDLQEETSDTYTVGAVISPRFIPRLNVTVDYFNITVEDVIGTFGGGLNSALQLCYTVAQNLSNPVCQVFAGTRNPTSGAIGQVQGGQNPLILSANQALLETSGIDAQVDYSQPLPFSLMGNGQSRLNFFILGTWLDKYRSTAIAAIPERVTIGEGSIAGNPLPEWRHTARLSLVDGPLTTSLRWRYFGEVEDPRIQNTFSGLTRIGTDPALLPNARVDDVHYFDLTFGFDVNDNFNINFGVNNLFDKKPEVLGSLQEQANTYPGTYDVLGRDFFVSGRLRF